MNILSLFDGISCARLAVNSTGLAYVHYFASEIDAYAKTIAKKNFPDTIQLGDINDISLDRMPGFFKENKIDLLIGGSPCQDLSIAKNDRKGLDGERSGLFWEYVRILHETNPKWFVLENVASMPKEARKIISDALGVEPIMINASLVSAQNRKRLFWTNIPGITQPNDRGILLKDIILDGSTHDLKALAITATYHKKNERDYIKKRSGQMIQIGNIGGTSQSKRVYSIDGKSPALNSGGGGQGGKTGLYITDEVAIHQRARGFNKGGTHREKSPTLTTSSFEQNNFLQDGKILRKLHPIECERLQGLPDGYTEGVSNTQRYKAIGNAFNVDVVAHILSFIPKNEPTNVTVERKI